MYTPPRSCFVSAGRNIFYLPKSRKLSKILDSLVSVVLTVVVAAECLFSDLNKNVNDIPMLAVRNDVNANKIKVLNIILPPNWLFRLAVTVTKLDISNGRVSNFNILRNISPGYDINNF